MATFMKRIRSYSTSRKLVKRFKINGKLSFKNQSYNYFYPIHPMKTINTYYFERIGNLGALDRNLMHGLVMKHVELVWGINIYEFN